MNRPIHQKEIAASDYEGWVAWIEDTPIFEAVPHNPFLTSPIDGAIEQMPRREDRQTLAWEDFPHEQVTSFELYFFRDLYANQPVIRIDRAPGDNVRYIQMKVGGIQLQTTPEIIGRGQRRTGVIAWKFGVWEIDRNVTTLIEVDRQQMFQEERGHPCWPRPFGFGIAPYVVGLTEEQIPPSPEVQ